MTPHTMPTTANEVAGILDRAYGHCRGGRRLLVHYRPYICPFEEILQRIPIGSEVLDVGCGVGLMGVLASATGRARRVVGFDTSSRAIEVGRRATLDQGELELSARGPDDWPEGRFDVVLCLDVLHHVPPSRQRAFCQRLVESVRPGGKLIFKDMAPRPLWKAWANRLHDALIAREAIHYRSAAATERWFREDGLDVRENRRLDRLWYAHYLIEARRPGELL